jgi:Fe-S-cluster containining protein
MRCPRHSIATSSEGVKEMCPFCDPDDARPLRGACSFLPHGGGHRMMPNEMALDLLSSDRQSMNRAELPQYVPSRVCLNCDVCCRFPEADSFLRPYFTHQEIVRAVASGVDPRSFPDQTGSQIDLVPNPTGDGYMCPAFDAATHHCRIYDARPLDCRLYPFALMWDAARERVVLGWDTKCPFMIDAAPAEIAVQAERVAATLATDAMIETIAANPRLVGRFQEDVVVLAEIPQLTASLRTAPVDARLRPLTQADAPRFARALERSRLLQPDALAAYSFAFHYVWTSLMPYWWMESDQTFYLFAQSPDGWFLPLPPLGPGPLERAVDQAFALLGRWNGSSQVSRIENVMEGQKHALEAAGFRLAQKGGDYLYRADDLATLAGDRYKSQRALCNRVEREQAVTVEPYRPNERAACLALYDQWSGQKLRETSDPVGRLYLEDARAAHALVFGESARMGLTGTVAKIDGTVKAYTFGYWLTPATWCVLLEVADRSVPGLAQFLFRETCRTAVCQGATFINAMDDGDLSGLRAAKLAYHPVTVIPNWLLVGH